MASQFIYNDENGTAYVKEDAFNKFVQRAKKLVEDQRTALRTRDKARITDCKKRETALLEWAENYEAYRNHYIPKENNTI